METLDWTQVDWKEAFIKACRTLITPFSRFRLVSRTGISLIPETSVHVYRDKFYLIQDRLIQELSTDGVITRQERLMSRPRPPLTTSLGPLIYLNVAGLGTPATLCFSLDSWSYKTSYEPQACFVNKYSFMCGGNFFHSKTGYWWTVVTLHDRKTELAMRAAVMRDGRLYVCREGQGGLEIYVVF